uniref:Squalene monooxygenase n=1 Tax=Sinocyclocheilus grahami TaxID=75366 RepID=A0A672K1Z8_SINGR
MSGRGLYSCTGSLKPDVIIVGAGVLGSSLSAVLGRDGRMVTVIERSLREPDRIMGELLRPAGYHSVEGLDAHIVNGWFYTESGLLVEIPYSQDQTQCGRAFHHGRFIMGLRRAALAKPNVRFIEGTVTYLDTGVQYKDKHSGKVQQIYFGLLCLHDRSIQEAVFVGCTKSIPASFLPSSPVNKPDAYSMRHPLTGGEMSIALNNVRFWRSLHQNILDLSDNVALLQKFHLELDVLAQALYELRACLCYFQFGGECVSGAVGLLSMLNPRPMTLIGHFFGVVLYAVYLKVKAKVRQDKAGVLLRSMEILYRACAVIFPLIYFLI